MMRASDQRSRVTEVAGVVASIHQYAALIADDQRIEGYTIWRSLKDANDIIYRLTRSNAVIPLHVVRCRAILQRAMYIRDLHGSD
jgi:hypothetical protein